MAPPMTAPLRLADHVRACCADGQVILLDLDRSKYIGVGGAQALSLARAIQGWPVPPDPTSPPAQAGDIDAFTASLRSQGLLTSASTAMPAQPVLAQPSRSLNAEDTVQDAMTGWPRLARFLSSAVTASAWLRWRSLAEIVQLVAARRARQSTPHGTTSLEVVREAVAAYLRLRPFAFTAQDRCLHDSLTLVHFLGSERMAVNWVIGVRTQPFGAHAWVQHGDTVLNDQHEHVRRYQPILVA
jgi:hypothetical protein